MEKKIVKDFLYEEDSYKIRGAVFNVWKLFRGIFKEKVIERALKKELEDLGLKVETKKKIDIYYKNEKIGAYVPDQIVNDRILIEIKVQPYLTKEDARQFWYYLRGSKYRLGFLINFGSKKLEIKRRVYDKAREKYKNISVNQRTYQRISASTNKGFTLVEILVSIFIIILMSGIIFTNYRQSGQQFALQRSASKLALDIRRAQEMAMSAKEFNGMIPPGGYGVYFKINEDWYTLFADCNNNGLYDDPSTTTPCSGFPETVEGNIVIEKPVWICEVCGLGVDEQIILFTPPEPKVTLSPAQDSSTVIVLRNDGQTKTVRVNKAGLIEIE